VKRTPLLVATSAVALTCFVIVGSRCANHAPPTTPAAAGNALPAPDEKGWVTLPNATFTADRLRWCSFVETAKAPERAGAHVNLELTTRAAEGMAAREWVFRDDAGALTLTREGATCFSNSKPGLPEGQYRMSFTIAGDAVAVDATLDGELVADAGWKACIDQHPEDNGGFTIPVVVDTDARVWASDGTRETDNLRACLGAAATAWAKSKLAAGAFPLTPPAVVFGILPRTGPAPSGPGTPIARPEKAPAE
jgi:hypothetical protein